MKASIFLLPFFPLSLLAQEHAPAKAYADPASTDADFPYQGEYVGEADGMKWGVQVIALGKNEFEAVGYHGGLPGAGWDGKREEISHTKGKRADGAVAVTFEMNDLTGEADGVKIYVKKKDEGQVMELERVDRRSPTLGTAAPAGAQILFNGKDQNRFEKATVTEDGLLTEGAVSADKFTDFTLHLEFRLPYMPEARGQGRGNSGVYLQGRYEVQVLDSFGLEGKDNECGGLYKISAPKLNMCFSPLTWQSYDIDFTAAKFDKEGHKTAKAKITARLNGVIVQENVELPDVTGGAVLKENADPGPIVLQNHGNPVRYRNIWALAK